LSNGPLARPARPALRTTTTSGRTTGLVPSLRLDRLQIDSDPQQAGRKSATSRAVGTRRPLEPITGGSRGSMSARNVKAGDSPRMGLKKPVAASNLDARPKLAAAPAHAARVVGGVPALVHTDKIVLRYTAADRGDSATADRPKPKASSMPPAACDDVSTLPLGEAAVPRDAAFTSSSLAGVGSQGAAAMGSIVRTYPKCLHGRSVPTAVLQQLCVCVSQEHAHLQKRTGAANPLRAHAFAPPPMLLAGAHEATASASAASASPAPKTKTKLSLLRRQLLLGVSPKCGCHPSEPVTLIPWFLFHPCTIALLS
jgi:hypothetical protein